MVACLRRPGWIEQRSPFIRQAKACVTADTWRMKGEAGFGNPNPASTYWSVVRKAA